MVASVPLVACLDVTTCEIYPHDVGLLDAYLSFSTSCDDMLALLALCHPFGSLCLFGPCNVGMRSRHLV